MNNNFEELKNGSTGDNVMILQEKLKILNFYSGSITGSFGEATELAVRAFQNFYDLEVTGIVDAETWALLFEYTRPAFLRNNLRQTKPTLQLGSTGEYVRMLQEQLKQILFYNGDITGQFDRATENAVKAFQSNNKLTANGIVNADTWSALTYLYSPLANCENGVSTGETYIVKSGDTLYSIARKYNTTVDEIKRLNNLTSNNLSVGQELVISEGEGEIEEGTEYYTVKSGDTLFSIAKAFGITVDELKQLNNLTSNTITLGQQLKISGGEVTPPETITYTVKSGDSLYAIARRYNTTVDEIKSLNNLTSNNLSIGQQLIIPTSSTTNTFTYTVKRGDSLYSIARNYNTTVDEIKRLNNLTNNNLSIGQQLIIST